MQAHGRFLFAGRARRGSASRAGCERWRSARPLAPWIGRSADWVTSVCTGSLLLYEAGVARGHRVATYWSFENELEARGDIPVVRDARYVVDGNLVTSQGVSAGIDMALWLVGHIHSRQHARAVRRYIQYDPAPPYLADEPLT